jgi:molecular chaperone GrpE
MIRYDEAPPDPEGQASAGKSAASDPRREPLPIDTDYGKSAQQSANETADQSDTAPSVRVVKGGSGDLDAVTRQRDEFYDLLLRKTAEFDNYRKRQERERRELSDYTTGEFVKELLPVLDDFARALKPAGGGAPETFRQGIELIWRRLQDALAKRGVTMIDPLGEQFDPHIHEAVARAAAHGHRDGEIVEVFSPGYKLGDRLLRPAMVKVATA